VGRVTGKLRVLTQSHDVCGETLIPWLNEFLVSYPELSLELDVKESLININDDEYDIFWGVSDYLGDRFPNLKRRQLWQSSYGIYASPEYLKREGTPETLDDLEQHYVVGYLYNQPSNVLVLQQDDKPVYKFLKQRITSVTGIVDLAISGLGLINAGDDTTQIISAVNKGLLVPVLQKHWWDGAEIYVYFHHVRNPQPKVKAFIDFFLDKREVWRNT
jgi:DNA-binding transcriptional LysR family regulator